MRARLLTTPQMPPLPKQQQLPPLRSINHFSRHRSLDSRSHQSSRLSTRSASLQALPTRSACLQPLLTTLLAYRNHSYHKYRPCSRRSRTSLRSEQAFQCRLEAVVLVVVVDEARTIKEEPQAGAVKGLGAEAASLGDVAGEWEAAIQI